MLMRRTSFVIAALLLAAAPAAAPARAEEDGYGSSFINPFPQGDVYNVIVVGDDMAEGLHDGLVEAFAGDTRLLIRPKHFAVNGLMRPDFAEKLVAFEEELKREPAQIAVVMLGSWDRVSTRDESGKRVAIGTPGWRKDYAERGDRLLKALKRQNAAVYWVGLPNVRRTEHNDDTQMMNDVLRERVYLNGMKFIDAFAGFTDENGGFSPWGPDITGKIVRLRDGDGTWFTTAGNRKLAHFAERDIKRDLTQAKANRSIPLAGTEEEQAKINPEKAKLAAAAPSAADGTGLASGASQPAAPADEAAAAAAKAQAAASGEQKADNGKISLRTISANGREEIVTLDIVRPTIPASVVALVTRRESADRPSQMGATLIDQIAGGLTVMNSVTPPSSGSDQGGAPKLSAAQTPYFRVLFKGERLTPRNGRADDANWPRTDGQGYAAVLKPAEAPAVAKPAASDAPATKPRTGTKKQ